MSHLPLPAGEGVGGGADFGPQMFRVLPLPMWHFEHVFLVLESRVLPRVLDCALLAIEEPAWNATRVLTAATVLQISA